MTIDEIIEQLKKLKSFHNGSYGASVNFAIDIIRKYQKIEQILKNIPYGDEAKTVRYEGDGYADGEMVYDTAFCPSCEHEFEEDSENWECEFCPNCGQRLRW